MPTSLSFQCLQLIFYVISANKHLYYNQSDINPITLFISWFNLDLGIETCFYDGLTAYARTWLQFIFPIYIWFIAGAIIFLANHSNTKRVAAISGNNGVPVLATLFLLSYAKLFNTIISVISYTSSLLCTPHKVRGWCGQLMEMWTISVLNMLHCLQLL